MTDNNKHLTKPESCGICASKLQRIDQLWLKKRNFCDAILLRYRAMTREREDFPKAPSRGRTLEATRWLPCHVCLMRKKEIFAGTSTRALCAHQQPMSPLLLQKLFFTYTTQTHLVRPLAVESLLSSNETARAPRGPREGRSVAHVEFLRLSLCPEKGGRAVLNSRHRTSLTA